MRQGAVVMMVILVCLVLAAVLAMVGPRPAKRAAPSDSDARPTPAAADKNTYLDMSVESLMPLKLGNSWTYDWKFTSKSKDPVLNGLQFYSYGDGPSCTARIFGQSYADHTETYKIVRQDKDHFFFNVTGSNSVKTRLLRDGRYGDAVEYCWTRWQKNDVGVTESIKRPWNTPAMGLLDGKPKPENDLPRDDRNVLMFPHKDGKIIKNRIEYTYTNSIRWIYDSLDLRSVTVPAGTFDGCVSVRAQLLEDKDPKNPKVAFETQSWWAPGVGMVKEIQTTPDGDTVYEMQLQSYDLK